MTEPAVFVERAREIAPRIVAARDRIERERTLPAEMVEAFREAGLFDLWKARVFDGAELHPADLVRVLEPISAADGSAGWCVANSCCFSRVSGNLPEAAARAVFGDGPVTGAGSLNPTGTAVAAPGGYRVSGRWAYGSGVRHAGWLATACVVHEAAAPRLTAAGTPEIRFAVLPTAQAEIIDTWFVGGLRGSGSFDYRVDDVFVPEGFTMQPFATERVQPGTLYALPLVTTFCVALAAVSLGIARAAIDALVELAAAKTPMGTPGLLRERAGAQAAVGQAEALLRSGRAFLLESVQALWDDAEAGHPTLPARSLARLACCHAAAGAAKAVDLMFNAAGGSALFESGRIERCFRDVHAARQHIGLSSANYELCGRQLLGLDVGTARF